MHNSEKKIIVICLAFATLSRKYCSKLNIRNFLYILLCRMILGISSDDTQNHKKMNIMLLPQKFLNLYSHRLIRSTSGNLPTLLARITAHKNPLEAVLHTGIARAQIGNSADVCQLCSVLCPRIPCAE